MNIFEKIAQRHKEQGYTPKFLSWATSYEDEERMFRELICGESADVKMLKQEYEILTGKRFRRKNDE
jgi:hypothetical protein